MNEQKAKCEATEKRESERRQVEEKKHSEEIQFLKRTNQQLKVTHMQAQEEALPPPQSPATQSQRLAPFPTLNTCPRVLSWSKGS